MLILSNIDQLSELFTNWVEQKKLIAYKIVLLLNSRIEVHFLVKNRLDISKVLSENVEFSDLGKIVTFYQVEYENKDDLEFFADSKIDLGLRRRLTNFIEHNEKQAITPCPVLTFYSYKGGTGRTTSLAFFASWLATHYGKKVVVIDCDFEAPGLINYFDISEDRKGIVEYLFDSEYAKLKGETLDIKKDYAYQIRHEYSGKGEVFIVPAGNLSNEKISPNSHFTYRSNYLECLARLDISSTNHIITQFESFFSDLKQQLDLTYENSVILIDSRTGFNDTFALLSILSDIIVGFFGINKQSQVGLTKFLDTYGTVANSTKQIILANSISENRNYETVFREIVSNYILENDANFTDRDFGTKDFVNNIYRIPRSEFLGKLGTNLESDDQGYVKINGRSNKNKINLQFYDKVQYPDLEFKKFFLGINEKVDFLIELSSQQNSIEEYYVPSEDLSNEQIKSNSLDNSFFEKVKDKVDIIARRERVLKLLINENNFPKPYADTVKEKPQIYDFFFRDCMKDIFNRDQYVIIGYKGTGKTHIYRSFENQEITTSLCNLANKSAENYIFVNVIPIEENLKYFSADLQFSKNEKEKIGYDYFFKNFWLVYSWTSLFLNKEVQNIEGGSSLEPFEIKESNANKILDIINDREKISLINNDLDKLDKSLLKINKTIILSYDQLDFVVKPNDWNDGIAPLINYWRTNTFSKIYPKIFVRADIFVDRLTNVTNFNEIQQEKSITLEWSKEELFAYFFKYVFKVAKADFFALSYSYRGYSDSSKTKLLEIENNLDELGQISTTEEDYLRFLVENFFGKSAHRYGSGRTNFGESYDWFYRNLADAKNAISIRPFLDLLHTAINLALKPRYLKKEKRHSSNSKQILQAYFYASNFAMSHAAERYYIDLQRDKGNEPLKFFHQYISNDGLEKFRIYEFTREQLDELLRRIIKFNNYKNEDSLKDKSVDDYKNLLVNNGVLAITHKTNQLRTRYIIPFLYRSYFSVSNPNKKNKTSKKRSNKK